MKVDFRIVYPNDREDLLKPIENNARLCGVIFDWDKYNPSCAKRSAS
ncbi:hypothetical protein M8494_01015 [Serratia ureilytica]